MKSTERKNEPRYQDKPYPGSLSAFPNQHIYKAFKVEVF